MARWDEILSLPVQNPPTLEFSAADLVWSKVEGWRDKIDRVALIPFARVNDFVKGESENKDCPSRFHVEARRRRRPEMTCKPKVDGILEYILYWCSFGPDDHRKGGIVRPSRTTYVPKKKNAGRPNTKRGCTCHFIVKRLIAEPSVALIIYTEDKHVDKKGLPCHGPQDTKAAGTRAMFAPYISEDLRLRVLSLLHVGVSVETIMQRHSESVVRQGGPSNRDDQLSHRYVRRQERSIRRSTYELDADDAVSIGMWVASHQNHVFFYEDFSDSEPFTLGIQTEWQLQQMIQFGNCSLLASDSRFGTNKLKYPIHSLVVFNSDKKAIPVAWIIAPRFASSDVHRWMRALYNRVRTKDPTWKLAGFIVDDPLVDVLTIRDVFQCSVLICFWRVRHAWHKNLVKKCLETEMRVEISRRLEQAVDNICRGQGTVTLFEDLLEDFIDESDFMDYFKAIWYPRIGAWTAALKSLPLASQETCAAMEFYHSQMKLRLLNEKDPGVYQRADWLVDKLGTKVHSYFWLDEYSGKDDFARYWKDEWRSGLTSWRKALKIPDSDVVIQGGCAKVADQLVKDKVYVVWNPGSQFGICNCTWAEMGNMCEHMFKVINLCRKRGSTMPSISIFQYHKALFDMLHCQPHDSLIRDHAISLAVCVQKQLNVLVDLDSSQTALDPIQSQTVDNIEQETVETVLTNQDTELVNESNCMNEDVSAHDENCGDVNDAPHIISGDVCDELNDLATSGNRISGENVGEEIRCAEMDVEPSSICISPPGLYSVDEVVASNAFSENGDRGLDNTRNKHLPSKVDSSDVNGFQDKDCDENMMDVEPLSIDFPPSTREFLEQCTVTHQDGLADNDLEPTVSNTPDSETKTSSAISLPVVGINLALCLLFFTLYSILRKQPGNINVYAPRLVAEGKAQQRGRFNLESLLPTASWVKKAWQPSEDELLSIVGFDAVVFMRIITFSLKVFSVAGVLGIFILLPINFVGTQLSEDSSDLSSKSLDSFSISNVNDGSNRLWIHFCAAYIVTGVVCYLLYYEYNYISSKRISYFYSSRPQPHQFTILVRGIPIPSGSTCSETVESFFRENHPSTYLSHSVVRRTSKLQGLISDAEKLYRRLAQLKLKNHTSQRFGRDGFLGIFGHKVDLLDHYEKKLEDVEHKVRLEQSSLPGKEVSAAFVSFKSQLGAAVALHIQQGINPTEWVTERAPEPHDVHWPFFSSSYLKRLIRTLLVFVACAALTILFLIPVVIVQSLTNLEQLETWFPFLEGILSLTVVSQVITGYLPSLILSTFLSFVPPIMIMFSSMQGYISHSQIEKSACIKVLWFTIWNIFFANVLSGTALYQVSVFLEPQKIPSVLAEAVPAQASFFIAYVVTSGWTSLSSELFRLIPLLCNFFKRVFSGKDDDEFEVPSISYHSIIPKVIFFGLLGTTYFFLSPLILPFLLVYYCMGYIIYRNQLLNVYAPKYETGGRFWPIVHDSTIFSLVLMHIIAIGIFGLKKLPLASSLIIPLPILTLLFHEYCQKRFLPIFKAYPNECLVKKDKEDLNDPTITEFCENLVTAYRDPALSMQYPGSTDGRNSPLLHSA